MIEKYEMGRFVFEAEKNDNIRTLKDVENEVLLLEEKEIKKIKNKITYCDGMKAIRNSLDVRNITYKLERRSKFGEFVTDRNDNIYIIYVNIEIWVHDEKRDKFIEIKYCGNSVSAKTDYEPYKIYCKNIIESLKGD